MVLDELGRGNSVVYVDFEDDEGGIVGRLLTLGADRLDARCTVPLRASPRTRSATGIHADDLDELLRDVRPTLAVVDGVTEGMTLHGLSPNDNSDVAKFGRLLPRRLAASGAASVSLDHVTKSSESRGRYSLGAVHKLNGLDGAAYVLENRTAFGVGLTGRSTRAHRQGPTGPAPQARALVERRHALDGRPGAHLARRGVRRGRGHPRPRRQARRSSGRRT